MRAGERARDTEYDPGRAGVRRVEVPDFPAPGHSGTYDYVILGAGCAGLSLCCALLRRGVSGSILILDRRTEFLDDRTWCFWEVEPTPFSHLAARRWHSWEVRAGGRSTLQSSGRYPYLCLSGADFYEAALGYVSRFPNVSLSLGQEAEIERDERGSPRITTPEGLYEAGVVLDCRGLPPGSPVFERARKEASWVPQRFVGVRVRAARPVFDASRCVLMDFSVDQNRGLRFTYALPFSEREALIENVYLSEAEVGAREIRAEALDYLRERYGLGPGEYEVLKEESGYIPMTDYRFPREEGGVLNVGMAGGETRPSTGYTFLRIQRYCDRLAESLARGGGAPRRSEARRYAALDGLFLRLMRESPELCPELYLRMFERVPPDSMVRFLTERSSPLDEARLIRALPKTPFLGLAGRASARALLQRLRG